MAGRGRNFVFCSAKRSCARRDGGRIRGVKRHRSSVGGVRGDELPPPRPASPRRAAPSRLPKPPATAPGGFGPGAGAGGAGQDPRQHFCCRSGGVSPFSVPAHAAAKLGRTGSEGVSGTARLGGDVGEAPQAPRGATLAPKRCRGAARIPRGWPSKVGKKLLLEEEPAQKRRGSEDAF